MSGDLFGCHKLGARGVLLVSSGWKLRDPTMHRMAPKQRITQPKMPNSAKAEEPCSKAQRSFAKGMFNFCYRQKNQEQVEMTAKNVWLIP